MARKFRLASLHGNSKLKEVCKTKSLTIPDQSLTVRELMQRHAQGTLDDLHLEDYYSMDEEDFRGIDPVDMYNMATEASDLLKKDSEKREKAKADKLRKKQDDEAVEAYKKSLEPTE